MIDVVVNVVWLGGAVLLWYPAYERLLKFVVTTKPDTEDRVFSFVISGIAVLFWPVVVTAFIALPGPFLFSRFVTRLIRAQRTRKTT